MAISGTDWLEVPIPYILGLFFRPKFQDSIFPGTLWSKSWIQPLDSRFKIPRNSLEQILNPTPGFKIQDSQELFGANLESILNPGFKISCKESLGILNLESWILDSRFAGKSPQESWILNPGVGFKIQGLDSRFGFKICSKESLGILNLESIQLAMALQRHCKLDRCQRSQGSKKVGLGEGVPYIYICIKKRKNTYKTGYLEHVENIIYIPSWKHFCIYLGIAICIYIYIHI